MSRVTFFYNGYRITLTNETDLSFKDQYGSGNLVDYGTWWTPDGDVYIYNPNIGVNPKLRAKERIMAFQQLVAYYIVHKANMGKILPKPVLKVMFNV